MKVQRIFSTMLASLLLVSGSYNFTAFAEEDMLLSEQPVVMAAGSGEGTELLIAAEADTATEAATETNPEEETEPADTVPAVSHGITDVRLTLAAATDTDGLHYNEDGTACYLYNGAALAGMFTVTPDYLMGDVNGDGAVNASDATMILHVSVSSAFGSETAGEILARSFEHIENASQAKRIADINLDGEINSLDASLILAESVKNGIGAETHPFGYAAYVADDNGILQSGWVSSGEHTYYAGRQFALTSGWMTIDGKDYYFTDDFHLAKDEAVTLDGKACYFNENAEILKNGWAEFDGARHYFNENGSAVRGLQLIDGQYYAFDGSGSLVIGWMKLGDTLRYSDETGILASGFRMVQGRKYYFDEAGVAHNGWLQEDGLTFYTNATGLVLTGEQNIDGEIFHFNADGVRYTSGWIQEDGYTRYLDGDGSYLKGLYTIGDGNYAFDNDGNMITGWVESNGKKYYAGQDGKLITGLFQVNGNFVYFDPLSYEMVTGWYEMNNARYYFDRDGIMLTGYQYIDGQAYQFGDDGRLLERHIKVCLDAGHAGKHNKSPVNPDYWESDFTWTYHFMLADALRSHGIEVITTRNDKYEDPSLASRGQTSIGCDLFLSIHSNAAGNTASCNTALDGPLACCNVDGSTDILGQQLANVVAEVMQTNYSGTIMNRVGDYGLDWYGVLRSAKAVGTPGILLEHSYHTNYRATVWLMDESNLHRMADAEAQVIANYFGLR